MKPYLLLMLLGLSINSFSQTTDKNSVNEIEDSSTENTVYNEDGNAKNRKRIGATKFRSENYKNRGIEDQPSIVIDGEGVIMPRFVITLGNDLEINKVAQEKGLILNLDGASSETMGSIACPCEVKKVKEKRTIWTCETVSKNPKVMEELIKLGVVNPDQENPENIKRLKTTTELWNYQKAVVSTPDGSMTESLNFLSEKFSYNVKTDLNRIKSAKLKRRRSKDKKYRSKSGTLTINIYQSGSSMIATPPGYTTTIAVTLTSEKTNYELKLPLVEQDGQINKYALEIEDAELLDKLFDSENSEEVNVTVQFGNSKISGKTLKLIDKTPKETPLEAKVYPNPTDGPITLELDGEYKDVKVIITNEKHELLNELSFESLSTTELKLDQEPGIYYFQVITGNQSAHFKVFKK